MHTPELITIPISHYCEKARWALEFTLTPYKEIRHLHGFHYLYSMAAAGSMLVPVLKTADGVIADSTDILNWCDARAPLQRKIRPLDPAQRKSADDLEELFDTQLGVAGRLWMYTYLLDDVKLIHKYSLLHGLPKHETALMPYLFPLIKNRIADRVGLSADSREKTKSTIDRLFDDVAVKIQNRKFLVGESFSSADLTFAALAAAVLIPENYGVTLPALEELPIAMQLQVKKWREHPAGQFAKRMFDQYRYQK